MLPHSPGNQGQIRSTANYVWSTNDVLGQGATGYVFRGRDKKSGHQFAIKVFNSMSYVSRSSEVRKREFDVLRKVNHENIVRLFAVEEETSSSNDVIIMELCTAGSLFMLLDDPENMYGFNEEEFKRVLKHITAGMKHLHDKGIVHRDLKPGNIMRAINEDGSVMYKLTDFGAARELSDNEQFMSLYGTEEYLHPDIYERAVLRKQAGKRFSATVDLWSMGVTFYHVATGQLPFRPYGGARRNKDGMYKITAEKPSGAISGVQNTEHGAIEWSKELPKTCRLSASFKQIFTPIISGILECDPHKIWTFERYFAEVEEIFCKKLVYVFSISSAMLHHVYVSPEKTLVTLQEHVAELTDIRSSRQLMLLDGCKFQVDSFQPVKDFPRTRPDQPILLLSTDISDFQTIPIPHTCKPPKVKQSLTLDNDASLAKVCSSTLFDIHKSVQYLLLVQTLIRTGVRWFVSYLKWRVGQVLQQRSELHSKVECLKSTLEVFEEHYQRETSLLRVISMVIPSPPEVNELTLYLTQITEKSKRLRQIRSRYEELREEVRKLERAVLEDDTPVSVFVDVGSCETDRLEERMTCLADKSRDICRVFKKHKQHKRLSAADEQLHKFEKQKLSEICEAAVSLFTDKSVPGCKRLHKESTSWFSNMNEYQKQIDKLEKTMCSVTDDCCDEEEGLRKLQRTYRDKLNTVESLLKEEAQRPQHTNRTPSIGPTTDHRLPMVVGTDRRWSTDQMNELRKGLLDVRVNVEQVCFQVDSGTEIVTRLSSLTSSTSAAT